MVYERKPLQTKFSEMYDKIRDRKPNVEFTTYRGYKPYNDRFYTSNINEVFKIVVGSDEKQLGTAVLKDVSYGWADHLTLEEIKSDTYDFYSEQDWTDLMFRYYKHYPVHLIKLTFEWIEVE